MEERYYGYLHLSHNCSIQQHPNDVFGFKYLLAPSYFVVREVRHSAILS